MKRSGRRGNVFEYDDQLRSTEPRITLHARPNLLGVLAEQAARAGLTAFAGPVLAANWPMLALLTRLDCELVPDDDPCSAFVQQRRRCMILAIVLLMAPAACHRQSGPELIGEDYIALTSRLTNDGAVARFLSRREVDNFQRCSRSWWPSSSGFFSRA